MSETFKDWALTPYVPKGPVLIIKCFQLDGAGLIAHVFVDDKPMGIFQRIEFRQTKDDVFPTVELHQIVYSQEGLERLPVYKLLKGVNYIPTFMNPDGTVVEEQDFIPSAE